MRPRQVGKSTLISQFVEHTSIPYNLFSADGVGKTNTEWISEKWHEARIRMMLDNETEHLLIIDEIQKIAGWSEIVKKEWDQDTREKRNLKVILLGSSRLLIQKGLEESIISPILNHDILNIEEIRNPSLLRQVFEIGSIYSAQELSLTKMQGVVNSGSVPTISSYLKILDETMLIKPLQKYDSSAIKTRNSIPKMQVYNNAFRNSYCQHTFEEALLNKAEWGRQVESTVGAQTI